MGGIPFNPSEREVTGCGDCPFSGFLYHGTIWQCLHPYGYHKDIAAFDEELITPEWCPLKQSPITISLKPK